jgi:hypothetical protein
MALALIQFNKAQAINSYIVIMFTQALTDWPIRLHTTIPTRWLIILLSYTCRTTEWFYE